MKMRINDGSGWHVLSLVLNLSWCLPAHVQNTICILILNVILDKSRALRKKKTWIVGLSCFCTLYYMWLLKGNDLLVKFSVSDKKVFPIELVYLKATRIVFNLNSEIFQKWFLYKYIKTLYVNSRNIITNHKSLVLYMQGTEFGNASSICTSMYCLDPSTDNDCVLQTAVRGTSCGFRKVNISLVSNLVSTKTITLPTK